MNTDLKKIAIFQTGYPKRYARFNGIQLNTRSSLLIRGEKHTLPEQYESALALSDARLGDG